MSATVGVTHLTSRIQFRRLYILKISGPKSAVLTESKTGRTIYGYDLRA